MLFYYSFLNDKTIFRHLSTEEVYSNFYLTNFTLFDINKICMNNHQIKT